LLIPPVLFRAATAAAVFLLASCSSGEQPADIAVGQAWTRETVAGQTSAAAYFSITNRGGRSDRLVLVSSPLAKAASLHSSSSEGGVARMRPIADGLAIPAGGSAEFKPGGNHVMLTGLSQPLKAGTSSELRLRFERSGERRVELRVLDAAASGGEPRSHSGH
jgi:copper(I)-binding protein